ncbi:MAG: SRPBCC domain-containing protein [Patescibacteria group bacterium]
MRKIKELHFEIEIHAPREKVWDTMLGTETYRQWTEPFGAGGSMAGSWDEGSKIQFLGPVEDGKTSGMTSRIKENRTYEFLSIEHLGYILNGVEMFDGPEIDSWAPAFENYTFEKVSDDKTLLKIDVQVEPKYAEMFTEQWPNALTKLKEMCEK